MKKKYLIFLFSVCILLVGCDQKNTLTLDNVGIPTDPLYNFDTDWQYYYKAGSDAVAITCSDMGYYTCADSLGKVTFIDRKSLKATPLCGKANCDHSDPETCNAYLVNLSMAESNGYAPVTDIQFYNDKLYFLAVTENKTIMENEAWFACCEPDGTNINRISKYPKIEMSSYNWDIHRGYYYIFGNNKIFRIPLNKAADIENIYTFENAPIGMNLIQRKVFYDDYLYVLCNRYEKNKDEETIMAGIYTIKINLRTLDHEPVQQDGKTVYIDSVLNGRLIFSCDVNDNDDMVDFKDRKIKYYTCLPDFTDIRELITVNAGENLVCDGRFFYINDGARIFITKKLTPEKYIKRSDGYFGQTVKILDLDLNEVDSFVIPSVSQCKAFNAQDQQTMIFFIQNEGESGMYILDKSKIGTFHGKPAELIAVER